VSCFAAGAAPGAPREDGPPLSQRWLSLLLPHAPRCSLGLFCRVAALSFDSAPRLLKPRARSGLKQNPMRAARGPAGRPRARAREALAWLESDMHIRIVCNPCLPFAGPAHPVPRRIAARWCMAPLCRTPGACRPARCVPVYSAPGWRSTSARWWRMPVTAPRTCPGLGPPA